MEGFRLAAGKRLQSIPREQRPHNQAPYLAVLQDRPQLAHLQLRHPRDRDRLTRSSWREGAGTRIPSKWKNKDHWGNSRPSSSCVYSAPLAGNEGLLFPAEDHCPEDGMGGKKNVSRGSVLATFSLWLTSEFQERKAPL